MKGRGELDIADDLCARRIGVSGRNSYWEGSGRNSYWEGNYFFGLKRN